MEVDRAHTATFPSIHPLMNSAVLTTIAATGFTVAFFHAAIPTHLAAICAGLSRARGWKRGQDAGSFSARRAGACGVDQFAGPRDCLVWL